MNQIGTRKGHRGLFVAARRTITGIHAESGTHYRLFPWANGVVTTHDGRHFTDRLMRITATAWNTRQILITSLRTSWDDQRADEASGIPAIGYDEYRNGLRFKIARMSQLIAGLLLEINSNPVPHRLP